MAQALNRAIQKGCHCSYSILGGADAVVNMGSRGSKGRSVRVGVGTGLHVSDFDRDASGSKMGSGTRRSVGSECLREMGGW